jgi:thiamine kinase-like enzyme
LRLMLGDDLEGRFSKYLKWNNLHLSIWLNNIEMPSSSSHSDLHVGNILVNNVGHPVIIDWGGYTAESSRFFDLINLAVTRKNQSWTAGVRLLFVELGSLYGIPLTQQTVIGYVLWKIDYEIKILIRYGKLNTAKVCKYVELLEEMTAIDLEKVKIEND